MSDIAEVPDLPAPNDKLGDRTVVASCTYRDLTGQDRLNLPAGDTWPDTVYLVLLLNRQAPFFTVAHVDGSGNILDSVDHMNIVPAINGDGPDLPGYTDMGGDY